VLLGAVFYLFLIAPQRRRQRQATELQSTLKPGDQVMTTAGMFATVHAVGDDDVELEVAPGVVSRYAKGAIMRVVQPGDADDEPEVEGEAEDDDEGTDHPSGSVDDSGDEFGSGRP
jgi:preprotein translocase subunit YajC